MREPEIRVIADSTGGEAIGAREHEELVARFAELEVRSVKGRDPDGEGEPAPAESRESVAQLADDEDYGIEIGVEYMRP